MDEHVVEAVLVIAPKAVRGKWLTTYRVGDEVLFSDKVDLQSDRARSLYIKSLAQAVPNVDVHAVRQLLQREAARLADQTIRSQKREIASKSRPRPAPGQPDNVDSPDSGSGAANVGGGAHFEQGAPQEPAEDDQGDAPSPESSSNDGSVRTQLLAVIEDDERYEVFFDQPGDDAVAYVSFLDGTRRSTWSVRSGAFKAHLNRRFKRVAGFVPSSSDLSDAVNAIWAIPDETSPTHEVHVRVAGFGDEIWIDMADAEGRVIRVSGDGWEIIAGSEAPVRFVRKRGMQPLIEPASGGDLEGLLELLNCTKDDPTFTLFTAFLVSSLRPKGPFAILVVTGQQGTAKSTACRVARRLIDPNLAELRQPIRDERDLMIAAQNSRIIALDNVSSLSPGISDRLCSLSTGAGFSTRELYSDDGEKLIACARPIMLNGIGGVVTRGDALDRSLVVTLEPIPPESRMPERVFWARFYELAPGILGRLLDGASHALRTQHQVVAAKLPRMADQAVWLLAAERGLGLEPGTFERALAGNTTKAQAAAVEASVIGDAVVGLMANQNEWEGTYPDLLKALAQHDPWEGKGAGFPKNGHVLQIELQRLNPSLAVEGLKVTFKLRRSDQARTRLVRLERIADARTPLSMPSRLSKQDGDRALERPDGDSTPLEYGQPPDSSAEDGASCPGEPAPGRVPSGFADSLDSSDSSIPLTTVDEGGDSEPISDVEERF